MARQLCTTWTAMLAIALTVVLGGGPFAPVAAAQAPVDRLKAAIGARSTDSVDDVMGVLKRDMEKHGAALAPEMRNYRAALQFQHNDLAASKRMVDALKAEIEKLEKDVQRVHERDGAQDEQRRGVLDRARDDVVKLRDEFERSRGRWEKEKAALAQEIARLRGGSAAGQGRQATTVEQLQKELAAERARRKTLEAKLGVQPEPAARTWTDSTGQHRMTATLVKLSDGKVILKKADGKTVALPIDKLSAADRAYLRDRAETP